MVTEPPHTLCFFMIGPALLEADNSPLFVSFPFSTYPSTSEYPDLHFISLLKTLRLREGNGLAHGTQSVRRSHFQWPSNTKFWIETHQVLWDKDTSLLHRRHFSVQSVLRRCVSCCSPPSLGLSIASKRPFNYSVASPAHTRARGEMYMLPEGSRAFWAVGSVWTGNGENRWETETIKQEKMFWGHETLLRAVNGPLRTRGEALCENHSKTKNRMAGVTATRVTETELRLKNMTT